MNSLFPRCHPFAVDAWFDFSCTLTYAIPLAELADRLPPALKPDSFQDQWGFIAVALVKTRHLRPSGFPAFLGNDFMLMGYRYFVRYRNAAGRNLRGLCILRSETDRKKMVWLGNLFTRYHYVCSDVQMTQNTDILHIASSQTGLEIKADLSVNDVLPVGSPFASWQDARKFSGPLPFTFSHDQKSNRMVIVEGVRSDWKPQPIHVLHHHVPYLAEIGHSNAILANAFIVKNIPYHWKKGTVEPCSSL